VVSANDAKNSKPAPDLVAAAAAKAELSPAQFGMIGDTIYDVGSAGRAAVGRR
jgi:phosphoglycolate phosphatase-like HAD superfamily hydrolase